jgi:putative MATE family efflux protein
MTQRTRRLGQEPVGRLLFAFSLPAIAGMAVASLHTVIDRAFLGNAVGPDAIGALSICMPIVFVIIGFSMLVGIGSAALVSIRLGQQNKSEAEVIAGNAVATIIVTSLALTTILMVALEPLLVALGASAATLPLATQFMHVILPGSVFQLTTFGLNSLIRAEGSPRLALATQLANAGTKIALDAVLILGLGYGVVGAAVATVAAQALSAGWTLAHFASRRSVLRLRLPNIRLRLHVLRPMLAIGLAPCCMQLGSSVVNVLINRALLRHGGDSAIDAYGVIVSLGMLWLMPVYGINQGMQPIVGYNLGAGQSRRVRETLRLAILGATAILSVGFVLVQTIPEVLIRLFADSQELVGIGARGLRLWFLVMPAVGFQIVSANFFQTIGKARTAIALTLVRQVIVLVPLLLILPARFGLDGVWAAGPIADALAALLTGLALARHLRDPSSPQARQTDFSATATMAMGAVVNAPPDETR